MAKQLTQEERNKRTVEKMLKQEKFAPLRNVPIRIRMNKNGSNTYNYRKLMYYDIYNLNKDGKPKEKSAYGSGKSETEALLNLIKSYDSLLPVQERIQKINNFLKTPTPEHNFGIIAEAFLLNKSRSVAEGTANTYERILKLHVLPKFEHSDIRVIRSDDLHAYLSNLNITHNGIIKKIRQLLNSIFKYAKNKYLIKNNPMDDVPHYKRIISKEKKHFLINADETDMLLEATKLLPDFQKRVFFNILIKTGARKSEIAALQWKHIDFDKLTLTIEQSLVKNEKTQIVHVGPCKTNKSHRTNQFGVKLKVLLLEFKEKTFTGNPEQFLFHQKNNKLVNPSNINGWFSTLLKKANWNEKLKPHDLRHSFICNLYEKGLLIDNISAYVGHANVTTTLDVYLKYKEKDQAFIADFFDR